MLAFRSVYRSALGRTTLIVIAHDFDKILRTDIRMVNLIPIISRAVARD